MPWDIDSVSDVDHERWPPISGRVASTFAGRNAPGGRLPPSGSDRLAFILPHPLPSRFLPYGAACFSAAANGNSRKFERSLRILLKRGLPGVGRLRACLATWRAERATYLQDCVTRLP